MEEAIEDVLPNDPDINEGQNPDVISDDEDHVDTVHSEPTTPQAAQHLDKLLEFSIAKNDERLSGLLLEVINAVENRNIVASTKQHTKFFQEV